jgi:hypothetical protein
MAAIVLLAGAAAPAFAKGHLSPEDSPQAQFGQERADESYVIGGETAAPAAKADDGDPGLDGSKQSDAAQAVERPAATGGKPK